MLLEGAGRWTAGDVVEVLHPDQVIVVPANTPHGFRNIGSTSLSVVSVHEAPKVEQRFHDIEPA